MERTAAWRCTVDRKDPSQLGITTASYKLESKVQFLLPGRLSSHVSY
jgi:hypothetical protein